MPTVRHTRTYINEVLTGSLIQYCIEYGIEYGLEYGIYHIIKTSIAFYNSVRNTGH